MFQVRQQKKYLTLNLRLERPDQSARAPQSVPVVDSWARHSRRSDPLLPPSETVFENDD